MKARDKALIEAYDTIITNAELAHRRMQAEARRALDRMFHQLRKSMLETVLPESKGKGRTFKDVRAAYITAEQRGPIDMTGIPGKAKPRNLRIVPKYNAKKEK